MALFGLISHCHWCF